MDYKAVSQQVVDNVGGLENIEGATHCVTRLRLVLKDTSKYNKAELENIDGVKGVLYNSGQLMIIFGTGTVNKVYDEFMALTGVKEISASEVKGAEADKKGKFFSVLKVFSDIFIPIIPAFVGAAIIIGLKSLIVANGLFGMEGSLADHSEFLKNLASFFAIIATTFDYLPVLVMYSAVKRFGGNPILGILVGIVMVHPSLMNRNTFVMDPTGAEYWNFGPLSIPMVAFQGGVFPAILTAWFMAKVEKIAQKYIPEVVSFVFVPTVTLILANVALFTVFGPLGNLIGDVLAGVEAQAVVGNALDEEFVDLLVRTGELVAGILQHQNEKIQNQDLRQKNQYAANAGHDAIHQQALQRAFRHPAGDLLARPFGSAFDQPHWPFGPAEHGLEHEQHGQRQQEIGIA